MFARMRTLVAVLVLAAAGFAQAGRSHVVFLVGEREYGSDETMPAFAQRLRAELGLRVTVLESERNELPALDALDTADLLVLFLRFRTATDAQFARLRAWFDAGKPCVALRTTSHAFQDQKGWFPPFFGGHYKAHAPNGQGTVSYVPMAAAAHPVVRGVATTVAMGHGGTYNAQPLGDEATVLLLGRTGRLPAEPIAWLNRYRPESRIFYTSLGSRENFERADFQRLLGNAVLWCLEREVPTNGMFAPADVLRRPVPAAAPIPAPPALAAPADATVLFDGSDAAAWRHYDPSVEPLAIGIDRRADSSSGGPVYDAARWHVENGALVARPGFGDVMTRESFGDYHLHVDFCVPVEPGSPAAFRGQSGIYLGGRYEVQIADRGDVPAELACGAVYGQTAPEADASRAAGTWQSLDLHYRHLQDQDPVLSAWLNGVPIHDRVRLRERTAYGFRAEPPGARSVAAGGGVRYARSPAESFDFGDGEFTIAGRFRTRKGGTVASKAPPSGEWQPNGKTLFLRGGRLVYDIGWVGMMQSRRRFDDGRWHRVVLTHDAGEARMFVDGQLVATRADFVAPDEPGHVFKIGATATDFGGAFQGRISDVLVLEHGITNAKAKQWSRGEVVDLGDVALTWTPKADEAGDEPASDRVVVQSPIRLQADSSPVRFANVWLRPLATVDHRAAILGCDDMALARGRKLYAALCSSCHSEPREAFASGLQRGDDPLALYRTLEEGFGDKAAMDWIPTGPRYDVIHWLRAELGLPEVGSDADYLATLPPGMANAPAENASTDDLPPYRRMDYGNALHWTYEVARQNIAQKAIGVRLDDGAGGLARGNTFLAFDHDLMNVAAVWRGEGFIDWKGVAFDGSHNTHAHIAGDAVFTNPVGPGWADPATGTFDDPRPLDRDGRPYGPLPRAWARFLGRHQHGGRSVFEYTVGDRTVLELPGLVGTAGVEVVTRTLEVGAGANALAMRVAPAAVSVRLDTAVPGARLEQEAGFHVLRIAAGDALRCRLLMSNGRRELLDAWAVLATDEWPSDFVGGGPAQWRETVTMPVRRGEGERAGAYAVDELVLPDLGKNPWHSWLRLGGFDFFADGTRAAVSTWNGDVWIVSGIGDAMTEVTWRRIAAGLFQPLGVRIVDETIYVSCRDQICVLEDRNGDGETDFYRCFNNDHQVTEHFHEFAMGLQTDALGDFYYCKSARHAKTALVPHHGTLLKVTRDGSRTEIVANGFRAANGVCVNDDGSFFVTDQEGHWTPKNRINRVVPGGFYGNMMGYHDRESTADEDMEPPLCWLTNALDRSPAELVRVEGSRWGLPAGALLQLSYGMGRVFLVLEDQVGEVWQGGMTALPIAAFPTGIMRGRFHAPSGQLFCCGLYGWSGARTRPGGFYRVRYTGGPVAMPVGMRTIEGGLELQFGTRLDPETANDPESYGVKTWQLTRSARYGSKHVDERTLTVPAAELQADGRTVRLRIPDLAPTMGLEIRCNVETPDEQVLRPVIHGTLHVVR